MNPAALRRRTSRTIWKGRLGAAVEWEPRDLWIGVFVKRELRRWVRPGLHIYICPLPTLVLHLMWTGRRTASMAAEDAVGSMVYGGYAEVVGDASDSQKTGEGGSR